MITRIYEFIKSLILDVFIAGKRNKKTLLFFGKNKLYTTNGKINILKGYFHFNKSFRKPEPNAGFLEMGKNAEINVNGDFSIYNGGHVVIMDNATLNLGSGYINRNTKIRCFHEITIGQNVAISENVSIWDSDAHQIIRDDYKLTAPINIGDHVWIGMNSVILKGVTLGDGCIVAAGSIVNKSFPAKCLIGGIPAKIIKENVAWK